MPSIQGVPFLLSYAATVLSAVVCMYKQQQALNNFFQEACSAISTAFYLWFWLLPH
jgi:hypothetical protein